MTELKASAEGFIELLTRSEAVLDQVARKLESEFAERFSDSSTNPAAIAQRIRKVSRDLPILTRQCQSLIQQKQALVDAAKQQLLSNHQHISALCAQAGLPTDDGPDADAYSSYNAALAEWDRQAGHRHHAVLAGDTSMLSRDELNRSLAMTMMQ